MKKSKVVQNKRRGGKVVCMRAYRPAFNVTFINFASKSLAFTPKFTAREREKTNQSRRTRIRGQRGGIEKRVVERALRESASARVCGERIF